MDLPTDQHAARGDRPTLSSGPPHLGRRASDRLFGLRARDLFLGRIGLGRRCPLGHRTLLSRNQVATGLGSVRSADLARLVPAYHAGHGCPCLPRRLSTAGVEKKPLPLPDRPVTVTVSLADLRRWLGFITPLTGPLSHRNCMLHWFRWRRRHQRIAQYFHWRRRQHATSCPFPMTLCEFLQL